MHHSAPLHLRELAGKMSNNFFKFKQFTIYQELCAMKVTTDACILGAISKIPTHCHSIADIGAGTGLLALMLAQRVPDANIDCIEIENNASLQAQKNISASPWANRISLFNTDINDYKGNELYDFIITNPPFFNNSLLSPKENKNLARHTTQLSYDSLLNNIDRLLKHEGTFAILLPYHEYQIWKQLCISKNWNLIQEIHIKHMPESASKRVVATFSKLKNVQEEINDFIIYHSNGVYSHEFTNLLQPFYLSL